ncbi:MAG: Ig-like domain-containing protein, partial [Acidaminobacteraceae bacterium]
MKKIILVLLFSIMTFSGSFALDEVYTLSKYIGDEFNIEKSIENIVENYTDYTFKWSASNYDLVDIFPNGDIKCIKDGKVQIIGYDDLKNKRIYINLTIKNQVKSIDIGVDELYIPKDKSLNLKAIFYYDYKDTLRSDELIWTSSNQKVATIDKNGLLRTLSNGTSYIVATSKDGSHKDYMKIIVDSEKLDIDVTYEEKINIGKTQRIEIRSNDKLKSNYNYRYISSDESIAIISRTGEITAKNIGVVYITITDGDNKRSIIPLVVNPIVKSIEVKEDKIFVKKLDDINILNYEINYIDGIDEDDKLENVKFSSSVPYVAYVTNDGKIIPRASGVTFITVSTNNGNTKDKTELTVDVPLNDSLVYNFKFDNLPKTMYVGEIAKLEYTSKSILSKPEFIYTVSNGSNNQIY